MAVYVNTNVSSLNGQRYLNNVQNSLNTTYTRLSSGLRINSAKDDSAGLQIADRLTSQINGLNQGNRNLAVQSANGTLGADDRKSIQNEADSLTAEITRIAKQTTFGGKTILAGYDGGSSIYAEDVAMTVAGVANKSITGAMLTLHVGANTGDTIDMEVYNFVFSKLASAAGLAGADYNKTTGFFLNTQNDANAAIASIDKLIAVVDSQRADLGAIQNRLESSIRNQANVSANSADARSRIRDADFAEESANLSQQSIIQQAATSMLMQANTRPQLALSMLG